MQRAEGGHAVHGRGVRAVLRPCLPVADDFYARLTPLRRFADLALPGAYAPVPNDWTVVITDVMGSTEAVRAGRYRDVNYVGAASIAAALNASGRADVPFVFGGDGATLVLPPGVLAPSLAALAALQEHAAERLALPLRVGVVPLHEVRAAGHDIRIARVQVSDGYAQALFDGSGLGWAEEQVKNPETAARYASTAAPSTADDPYGGLECRWHDVASPHGETVALLVQAVGAHAEAVYAEVLETIERIYGPDDAMHPVALENLRLRALPVGTAEARLRATDARRRLSLAGQGLIGRVLLRTRRATSETDWGAYPGLLRAATDYRKFDGVLRMILAGASHQRVALCAWLEQAHSAGRLVYGLHVSDRAVLTCLVYERMGRQVHFVDAAEGGYTQAAVGFKQQLKALAGHAKG